MRTMFCETMSVAGAACVIALQLTQGIAYLSDRVGLLGPRLAHSSLDKMVYMSRTTLVSAFASQTLSLFWSWLYLCLSRCLLTGAAVETGDVYVLLHLLLWRCRGHRVVIPFLIKAVKSRVLFKHYIENPHEISYAYIETTDDFIQN